METVNPVDFLNDIYIFLAPAGRARNTLPVPSFLLAYLTSKAKLAGKGKRGRGNPDFSGLRAETREVK